jgi:hypothetical protein
MEWPSSKEELWSIHTSFYKNAIAHEKKHEITPSDLAWHIAQTIRYQEILDTKDALKKFIPLIITYTYNCSPFLANAASLILAAEFLLIVFLFDDKWEIFEPYLQLDKENYNKPEQVFIVQWLKKIQSLYGDSASKFLNSFLTYYRSLIVEANYIASQRQLTMEEYTDKSTGRYQWTATPTYIDLWELTMKLLLTKNDHEILKPFKDLAVEMTYIANDIASLERDEPSINLLTILAEDCDSKFNEEKMLYAINKAAEIYCIKAKKIAVGIEQFKHIEQQKFFTYFEMLEQVIDGNLLSIKGLSLRTSVQRYGSYTSQIIKDLPFISSIS